MRLLLSLALAAAACVSAAHASTLRDDFTYTYVLSGNTYITTFSLTDGQATSLPVDPNNLVYTYQGVALNGNAASRATVRIAPSTIPFFGVTAITDGFSFSIFNEAMPDVVDFGSSAGGNVIQNATATSITFTPGMYAFDLGTVRVAGTPLLFDRSSLTITQTVLPDPTPTPTPVAVTPEPGTLALLGTGLLGIAAAARRRLLPTA